MNPFLPENFINRTGSRTEETDDETFPGTMTKVEPSSESLVKVLMDPGESKEISGSSENALARAGALYPSLKCLVRSDFIILKQEEDMIEKFCGCETNIRYQIIDERGKQLLQANELPVFCAVYGAGKSRPFRVKIFDLNDQDVLQLRRPCTFLCYRMPCCCCWPYLYVYSSERELVGSIKQKCAGIFRPRFSVKNNDNETIMRIEGTSRTTRCFGTRNLEFHIVTSQGRRKIGQISRINNNGPSIETFLNDVVNMKVEFPKNTNLETKSLLIAAALLIDFLYYKPRLIKEIKARYRIYERI